MRVDDHIEVGAVKRSGKIGRRGRHAMTTMYLSLCERRDTSTVGKSLLFLASNLVMPILGEYTYVLDERKGRTHSNWISRIDIKFEGKFFGKFLRRSDKPRVRLEIISLHTDRYNPYTGVSNSPSSMLTGRRTAIM